MAENKFYDIPSLVGYQANKKGAIRSIDRYVPHKRTGKQFVKGKLLTPYKDKDGYLTVGVRKNSKAYTRKIHRLVAETFLKNKCLHPMINHKNSKRDDNRVENLEWCNNSHNQKHAFSKGKKSTFGEKHSQNKLRQNDVYDIVCQCINGESKYKIAKKYNVCPQTIYNIVQGKSWMHITKEIVIGLISCSLKHLNLEHDAKVSRSLEQVLISLRKRGVEGTLQA